MEARTEGIAIDRLTSPGGKASVSSQSKMPSLAVLQALLVLCRSVWRSRPARFISHFLEMVVAMVVGMPVVGVISAALAPTFPILRAPTVFIVLMVIFMTVPMVAWMRIRGHTWRQAGEMTAAMLAPTAVPQIMGLSGPVYMLAMLLGMLALMLYRRDEYLDGHCH